MMDFTTLKANKESPCEINTFSKLSTIEGNDMQEFDIEEELKKRVKREGGYTFGCCHMRSTDEEDLHPRIYKFEDTCFKIVPVGKIMDHEMIKTILKEFLDVGEVTKEALDSIIQDKEFMTQLLQLAENGDPLPFFLSKILGFNECQGPSRGSFFIYGFNLADFDINKIL